MPSRQTCGHCDATINPFLLKSFHRCFMNTIRETPTKAFDLKLVVAWDIDATSENHLPNEPFQLRQRAAIAIPTQYNPPQSTLNNSTPFAMDLRRCSRIRSFQWHFGLRDIAAATAILPHSAPPVTTSRPPALLWHFYHLGYRDRDCVSLSSCHREFQLSPNFSHHCNTSCCSPLFCRLNDDWNWINQSSFKSHWVHLQLSKRTTDQTSKYIIFKQTAGKATKIEYSIIIYLAYLFLYFISHFHLTSIFIGSHILSSFTVEAMWKSCLYYHRDIMQDNQKFSCDEWAVLGIAC